MIRRCREEDFGAVHTIINESAQVYRGVIPKDCWKEPYMEQNELRGEISDGVVFWGYEENGVLLGVMGIQDVKDVSLIRHAYVTTTYQNRGIGSQLLSHLRSLTNRPFLVGTWEDADVGCSFLQKSRLQTAIKRNKGSTLERVLVYLQIVRSKPRWFSQTINGLRGAHLAK